MKKTIFLSRVAVFAAFAVMSVGAHAVQINLVSQGDISSTDNFTTNFEFDENVIFQLGGFAPLNTYQMIGTVGTPPFTATYTGAGSDSLTILCAFAPGTFDSFANTASVAGNWTYVSGTGTYANKTGSGTISVSYDMNSPVGNGFASYTTTVGRLEAVPEPASMAVLGLGLAAVVRRRRNRR